MAKVKKPTPTYEEFREAVKEWLIPMLEEATEEEIEKYLSSKDTTEILRRRYEEGASEYEAEKITYEVFTGGVIGSVGYCLYMLYE